MAIHGRQYQMHVIPILLVIKCINSSEKQNFHHFHYIRRYAFIGASGSQLRKKLDSPFLIPRLFEQA